MTAMIDMRSYQKLEDLPGTLPVFPLSGALLLPRTRLPLNIFEPRYLQMVDDALGRSRLIGMIQPQREGDPAQTPAVFSTGCVGRITSFSETADGRYLITLTGLCRFRVEQELEAVTPYRQTLVSYDDFAGDLMAAPDENAINRAHVLSVLKAYFTKFSLDVDWESIQDAPMETLINSLAIICPFESGEKQALLEAVSLRERTDTLVALLEMAVAAPDDEDHSVQ